MFTPHTEEERNAMLGQIGLGRVEDLFTAVPAAYRFPELSLPASLSEMEAVSELSHIAAQNKTTKDLVSFLGAGAYNHYIPAAVDALLQRGEFYSAYTPYQPEISQGTLQAIYEYQSLIAALTGMEVSNASHYDGATSAAEAISLAYTNFRGKRTKVILSPTLHPQYRATIHTYNTGSNIEFVGEDIDTSLDPKALEAYIDGNTALVFAQYPDFFGRVYDYSALAEKAHAQGALLALAVNPTALGVLRTPGSMGADIVTGEGQPLGIPLSFGGPYLGLFATRLEYVRKMAGRLVGETVDNRGQRAFVLTLTAREQHIRREKATSNICTNQGLMALAATIYLTILGKHGFRQVAELCYHKAHYAADMISQIPGFKIWSTSPFFHEVAIECPLPARIITERLLKFGLIGGYPIGNDYPGMDKVLLLAVTELNQKTEIDFLVEKLAEVSHG